MKNKGQNKILYLLLFIFAIAVIAFCGGGGGGGTSGGSGGGDGSATIITGPDGTKLTIPNSAASPDTTYRIARRSDGAPELVGVSSITPIYEITPHGSAFTTDALVTLPFDTSFVPQGEKPFMLKAQPGGNWKVLRDADTSAATLSGDVDSLSWYAVGVCTPDSQGYSFGAGDCPANHELMLEYLDDIILLWIPVLRDSWGNALPFPPDITSPKNITVRVTWTRPADVNRNDNVRVSPSNWDGITALTLLVFQTVNQQVFTRNYVYAIDPSRINGAAGQNGAVVRFLANAWYCADAFVIGVGTRNVCWGFDTDIAFRVRYAGVQPTITQQPAHQSVTVGQTATFSVAASGTNPTYQWQRSNDNGQSFSNISGATGSSYQLTNAQLSDNGALFLVRVCSGSACVDSWAVELRVTALSTLPTFTQQPASMAVVAGQTASFTAVATGPPAPNVQWYKFDGILGIPVGTLCSSSSSFTACTYTTPPLSLADSGSQYYAVARNSAGSVQSNTVTVTVTSAPIAPTIITQPSDITVNAGGNAPFSVVAGGTAPLSYQWRRNSVDITGENGSSYTLNNAQTSDSGAAFSVVVSNSAGSVTSNNARLSVTTSASGSLDTTFGTGGIVVHNNAAEGNGDDAGNSIVTDASGRILVTGSSVNASGNEDMAIWRYMP